MSRSATNDDGVSIVIPIGDNQANIIGSRCQEDTPLINLGTGGQISIILSKKDISRIENVNIRPFIDGKNLLVGVTQCGGYAYTLLKRFFEKTADMLGIEPPPDLFARMESAAARIDPLDCIQANTTFLGTYSDPAKRAEYFNISENNFTPGHLTYATLHGISKELFDIYHNYLEVYIDKKPTKIIGAGNCIRSTPLIKKIIENIFSLPLHINPQKEEAVYGAALLALSKMNPSTDRLI